MFWFISGFIGTFIMVMISLAFKEMFPNEISGKGSGYMSVAILLLMFMSGPISIIIDAICVFGIILKDSDSDSENLSKTGDSHD